MKRSVAAVIYMIVVAFAFARKKKKNGGHDQNGKDAFHVYIAFGQSNMQGPGEVRAQDKTGISERWRILNVVNGR
jgi:hypothetical protein